MAGSGSRKVLVAVDQSETSENAFQWYLDNMAKSNDEVIGITVVEYVFSGLSKLKGDPIELSKQFAEQQSNYEKLCYKYKQMMSKVEGLHLTGNFQAVQGNDKKPGPVIVEKALEENVSCIVLGTRGLGKFKKMLLGSVSSHVVNQYPCPVTVVPLKPLTQQQQ